MKKETRSRRLRCVAVFLCALLLLTIEMPSAAAKKVSQSDIDALKKDAAQLDAQRKDIQNKLSGLAQDKSQVLQRKNLLDEQISNTASRITNVETQISEYSALITQTEAELADAQSREKAQYELFCRRVRAMEEGETVNYWSFLFRSSSFSNLLDRLDMINEIMDADQQIIDGLKTLQAEISQTKEGLEENKASLEAARADLVSQKSELNQQRNQADKLVQEIRSNENEYKSALNDLEEEEERIQKEIVELSRQLAAQQGQGQAALGGYIWPVSSRRITSPFGRRNTGIAGASTNHKGVDVGGVGYTSEVRAAKAGTVIVSQRSSSYGHYVVVSHGSGNTTLYAHMSSRKVSVGKTVKQGDLLGITGSTGISSGPHLHFEITENGNRIDPLKYLTGYVKAW